MWIIAIGGCDGWWLEVSVIGEIDGYLKEETIGWGGGGGYHEFEEYEWQW